MCGNFNIENLIDLHPELPEDDYCNLLMIKTSLIVIFLKE